MGASIIIENVKATDLPQDWAKQLDAADDKRFTVRIEEAFPAAENAPPAQDSDAAAMPAFGMWHDHDETADVTRYVRTLRAPRIREQAG